jgi:hypothetical protein
LHFDSLRQLDDRFVDCRHSHRQVLEKAAKQSRLWELSSIIGSSPRRSSIWAPCISADQPPAPRTSRVGKAFDPANPANNWTDSASFPTLISETATNLQFRDDMQLMTSATLNDSSGLTLVAGSEMVFANNGSVPLGGAINSGSNTAYPTSPNLSTVLNDLTTTSDHLPMVADYQFPSAVPEPASLVLSVVATLSMMIAVCRRRTSADSQIGPDSLS